MHVGDRWEFYIPAEQAYGKISCRAASRRLYIYDIELIAIS